MKILSMACRALPLGFFALSAEVHAQNSFVPLAGEYPVVGALQGDQTYPTVGFNGNGGWLCWQDNATDGDGLGISARRLNSSLSGDLAVFRMNQVGAGDQENPQVSMLNDGGAVAVWQGGNPGFQKIYARFISSNLTFRTGDVMVNTFINQQQIEPSVATLADGNVAVVWQSYGQDGENFGCYGRILNPNGGFVGNEFQINQTTSFGQRNPVVAPLTNGNFVVAWASEQFGAATDTNNPAGQFSVDIMGRIFNPSGSAVGDELLLSNGKLCANPHVVGTPDGGFVAAWSQRDLQVNANSWDGFGRSFDSAGNPRNGAVRLNSAALGDQVGPKAAVHGTNILFVWMSMGQDGSQEGVYGQYAKLDCSAVGGEFRVNTTTISKQVQPCVAADASGRFLVGWSSFTGLSTGFDLFAQRYSTGISSGLIAPAAPYVFALSSQALNVTWPEMSGYVVAFYELYVDGGTNPIVVNGIQRTVNGFTPGSSHTFRLLYQLVDGRRSPLSSPTQGTTWGYDNNGDGLPDDWQTLKWGANSSAWPASSADSDNDGASNLMEFLAGTDPNNAASVLRSDLQQSGAGFLFSWNTQPGLVYQLQSATALGDWQNVGWPRFAHGTVDSVTFSPGTQSAFYRVICLR